MEYSSVASTLKAILLLAAFRLIAMQIEVKTVTNFLWSSFMIINFLKAI